MAFDLNHEANCCFIQEFSGWPLCYFCQLYFFIFFYTAHRLSGPISEITMGNECIHRIQVFVQALHLTFATRKYCLDDAK